jgi:hypothetical protein
MSEGLLGGKVTARVCPCLKNRDNKMASPIFLRRIALIGYKTRDFSNSGCGLIGHGFTAFTSRCNPSFFNPAHNDSLPDTHLQNSQKVVRPQQNHEFVKRDLHLFSAKILKFLKIFYFLPG